MKKHYLLFLALFSVIFAASFVIFFYALKNNIVNQFNASAPNLMGLKNFGMLENSEITNLFEKFGALAGPAFGIVAFLLGCILLGICSLLRIGKNIVARFIIPIFTFGLLFALGTEFLYLEERTTVLVRSIIFYIGIPLFYGSILTLIVVLLIGIFSFIKKIPTGKTLALFMIFLLPLLSGCNLLSGITYIACSTGVDNTHCYQEVAISGNDEKQCENVKPPKEFQKSGSNPPQDKCYTIVAENKKDPTICNKIKGGIGSYDKGECIETIVEAQQKEVDDLLKKLKTESKPDQEATLKAQIQENINKMNKVTEMMTNIQKTNYDMQLNIIKNLGR